MANWIFEQAQGPKLLLIARRARPTLSPPADRFLWTSPDGDICRNQPLLTRPLRELEAHHDAWVGLSRRRVRLLILRNPFNLFASRLKMGAALSVHVSRAMWKQHAREAAGDTQKIRNGIVVLYDRWVADRSYRRGTAERLGLKFTDAGASRVPKTMGGSSFDGTAFDGRAAEMATNQRWKAYVGDPDYRAIFEEEMISLASRLFGPPPEALRMPRQEVVLALRHASSPACA